MHLCSLLMHLYSYYKINRCSDAFCVSMDFLCLYVKFELKKVTFSLADPIKKHHSITAIPQFLLSLILVGNGEVKDHMSNFDFVQFLYSHNNPFHVAGWLNSSVIMQSKHHPTLPTNALALVGFFSLNRSCSSFSVLSISENLHFSTINLYLFSQYFIWNGIFYNSIIENIYLHRLWKCCTASCFDLCYLCFSWIYCNLLQLALATLPLSLRNFLLACFPTGIMCFLLNLGF